MKKYTVILRGEILFKGENLLKYSGRKMQSIRGDEISMVFQDALSALNPVMRVGDQIMEAIKLHNKGDLQAGGASAQHSKAGRDPRL